MLARIQLRTMAHRLGKDKFGKSATELVYLGVFIVFVAAVSMLLLNDSLQDFFYGFSLTQAGITFR